MGEFFSRIYGITERWDYIGKPVFIAKESDMTKKTTSDAEKWGQLEICLYDSRHNVYELSKKIFGREIKDIFEQVEKHCNLVRCEECGLWISKDEASPNMISPHCYDCAGDEDDD